MAVDQEKLEVLLQTFARDVGAAIHAATSRSETSWACIGRRPAVRRPRPSWPPAPAVSPGWSRSG